MIAAQPGDGSFAPGRFGQPERGPTAVRMVLGAQLRRRREAAGITREAAGKAINASYAKLRRLELGSVGCKEPDVVALLTLYRVDDPQDREALLALTRHANAPSWWHRYGDVLPSRYDRYLGLEQAASLIRSYDAQTVPGLLQTEDYARAVAGLGDPGGPAEEIERRVKLRRTRQELLTRPEAPQVWAVVGQAAFQRPLGGLRVMHAQVQYLLEVIDLPNVTLQIAPAGSGGHAVTSGSFTILRFGEYSLPDVVCFELLTGALYLDNREDIDRYRAVMDRLCVEAEPSAETAAYLHRVIERF